MGDGQPSLPLCPDLEDLEGSAPVGKGLETGADKRSLDSASYFGGRLVGLIPPLQPPRSAAHLSSGLDFGAGGLAGAVSNHGQSSLGHNLQPGGTRPPPTRVGFSLRHGNTRPPGAVRGGIPAPQARGPRPSHRRAPGLRLSTPCRDSRPGSFPPPKAAVPLGQRDSHRPAGPGRDLAWPQNAPTDQRSKAQAPGAPAQRWRVARGAEGARAMCAGSAPSPHMRSECS